MTRFHSIVSEEWLFHSAKQKTGIRFRELGRCTIRDKVNEFFHVTLDGDRASVTYADHDDVALVVTFDLSNSVVKGASLSPLSTEVIPEDVRIDNTDPSFCDVRAVNNRDDFRGSFRSPSGRYVAEISTFLQTLVIREPSGSSSDILVPRRPLTAQYNNTFYCRWTQDERYIVLFTTQFIEVWKIDFPCITVVRERLIDLSHLPGVYRSCMAPDASRFIVACGYDDAQVWEITLM